MLQSAAAGQEPLFDFPVIEDSCPPPDSPTIPSAELAGKVQFRPSTCSRAVRKFEIPKEHADSEHRNPGLLTVPTAASFGPGEISPRGNLILETARLANAAFAVVIDAPERCVFCRTATPNGSIACETCDDEAETEDRAIALRIEYAHSAVLRALRVRTSQASTGWFSPEIVNT